MNKCYQGCSKRTVNVPSSTQGKTIALGFNNALNVMVPPGAAAAVWFLFVNPEEDANDILVPRGIRIAGGNGFTFTLENYGWAGKVGAILETGSTAVAVEVMEW
jgi:hypothetical protein